MKNYLLLLAIVLLNIDFLIASDKGNLVQDSVVMGASYKNEVWYNMITGVVKESDINNWDIAFETGQRAGIHANGSKGIRVWVVPDKTPDDFNKFTAKDTLGMSENWKYYVNSPDSWSVGAFNLNLDGYETGGDFGWGNYDLTTHAVVGKRLFVVKLNNSTYKKFFIEALANQEYSFTYANLDGSDEAIFTIKKTDYKGKNFAYFSFSNAVALDREPMTNDWHLNFSKYEILIPTGPTTVMPYVVTGVRSNKNVRVAKLTGVDPYSADSPDWNEANYSTKITKIGSDWKTFNNEKFEYELKKDWVYFVSPSPISEPNPTIFRLIFTGFEGSSTGKIFFEKQQLTTSIIKENNEIISTFSLYPNVVSNKSNLNLVINSVNNYENAEYYIYTIDGQLISSNKLNISNNLNIFNLSLNNISKGLYFIKLRINNSYSVEKFIVE